MRIKLGRSKHIVYSNLHKSSYSRNKEREKKLQRRRKMKQRHFFFLANAMERNCVCFTHLPIFLHNISTGWSLHNTGFHLDHPKMQMALGDCHLTAESPRICVRTRSNRLRLHLNKGIQEQEEAVSPTYVNINTLSTFHIRISMYCVLSFVRIMSSRKF